MPFTTTQDVRIHYQVKGDGPLLVLQHGFTQNLKRWQMAGYVDALKSDYQLILIDARGHGESDKPYDSDAYTLPLRVGDVVAVLDDLNIDKAHYWGFSMGGRIGFGLAAYAPTRVHSLVLGGMHPYGRQLPPADQLDGDDPDAFVQGFFKRLGVDLETIPPKIKDDILTNDFQALAASLGDYPSLEEVLPTMSMPCLLYCGDADGSYAQAQACIEQMPNAEFVTLPGLNHSQGFNRADLALPHVMPFLQAAQHGHSSRL